MMNFLFNANIHTEQENQQHDVAHEWRQVALQKASNPMRIEGFPLCSSFFQFEKPNFLFIIL